MARTYQFRQISFGTSWLGRLGLVAGIALAIAAAIVLVILSLSLAIVLVPVVALALVVARWRLGRAQKESGPAAPASNPRVIETEYVVIDRTRDPR